MRLLADVTAAAGRNGKCAALSGGGSPPDGYFDQSGAADRRQPRPIRNSSAHHPAAGASASAKHTAADQHAGTGGTMCAQMI